MTELLKKRLFIKTYGCQMNVHDSERMVDVLRPLGYELTGTADDADLVVLNTCHIREKASEKVYSELGRLRVAKEQAASSGRDLRIAVAGCVAQAEGEEIMRRTRWQGDRDRIPAPGQIRIPAAAETGSDPRPRHFGLRDGAGRLRQVLH